METIRTLTPEAHAELQARLGYLQEEPEKTRKATMLVEECRFEPVPDQPDTYQVIGLSGQIYTTSTKVCSCKARRSPQTPYPCYHMLGLHLYRSVASTMAQQGATMYGEAQQDRKSKVEVETPSEPQDGRTPTDMATTGPCPDIAPTAPSSPQEGEKPAIADMQRQPQVLGILPVLELPRRSISAILADLSKPLPDACVGTKPKGGATIRFLNWTTVVRLLDTYAPGWQGAVVRVDKIGERIAVTYRISIPALEGSFSHEDAGMEDEDKDDYGDAMTNAIAAALKRTAAKFGVGRWLYEKPEIAKALSQHLSTEVRPEWTQLGLIVDSLGLPRETVEETLKRYTGAATRGEIPLWALRAMISHLRTQPLMVA